MSWSNYNVSNFFLSYNSQWNCLGNSWVSTLLFPKNTSRKLKISTCGGNQGCYYFFNIKNCIHSTFQYCITCKHCKISTRMKKIFYKVSDFLPASVSCISKEKDRKEKKRMKSELQMERKLSQMNAVTSKILIRTKLPRRNQELIISLIKIFYV